MNTFLKFSAIALVASLGFVSCQKEQLEPQSPVPASAAAAQSAVDDIVVGVPKKYTLIKHGTAALTYYADGKLKRVSYGNWREAPATDYTYGAGWVDSKSYANGKIDQTAKYLLDANGRCVESSHDTYSYVYAGGAIVSTQTFKYEYAASGLLSKKYKKSNPVERTDYISGGDPDNIHQARSTNANGVEKEVVQFIYGNFGVYTTDRNHLNHLVGHVPDEYLQIFGKPTKSLVKGVNVSTYGQPTAKWTYENTLNADGYLTSRKETNALTNVSTNKAFDYLVTIIGIQQ